MYLRTGPRRQSPCFVEAYAELPQVISGRASFIRCENPYLPIRSFYVLMFKRSCQKALRLLLESNVCSPARARATTWLGYCCSSSNLVWSHSFFHPNLLPRAFQFSDGLREGSGPCHISCIEVHRYELHCPRIHNQVEPRVWHYLHIVVLYHNSPFPLFWISASGPEYRIFGGLCREFSGICFKIWCLVHTCTHGEVETPAGREGMVLVVSLHPQTAEACLKTWTGRAT